MTPHADLAAQCRRALDWERAAFYAQHCGELQGLVEMLFGRTRTFYRLATLYGWPDA